LIAHYRSLATSRVVGLISGTSADAIEAVLVEITGASLRFLRQKSIEYDPHLRKRVFALMEDRASVREAARVNVLLGEAFAQAALQVLQGESADLIASHGQTVVHLPSDHVTLQLAEPAVIAARTNTLTVADFRPADVALGGQGAPLVPFFDAWLLGRGKVALNLGGMANVSWIPPEGDVLGWDTGPGNVLSDAMAELFYDQPMDRDGALAAQGMVVPALLDELLQHPYFAQTGPKSTGREEFGRELAASLRHRDTPVNLLRTALALTAETIARSLAPVVRGPFEVVVGGGGLRNHTLAAELRQRLEPLGMTALRSFDEFGVPAAGREAAAFAVMGHETIWGRPGVYASVTGAGRSAVLGKIVFPPR
jgi:anhydro-N-acetylmuramic acid kinase